MIESRAPLEQFFRQMRRAVFALDDAAGAAERRERTVAALGRVQQRAVRRAHRRRYFVRPLLAAAVVLTLPAVAFAVWRLRSPSESAALPVASASGATLYVVAGQTTSRLPESSGDADERGALVAGAPEQSAAPAASAVAPPPRAAAASASKAVAARQSPPARAQANVPARDEDPVALRLAPVRAETEVPAQDEDADEPASSEPTPIARTSTLGEENTLLARAMAASRSGDSARAVTLLDTLLSRYPQSTLRQNALVERFRALSRQRNRVAAARAARRYLSEYPDGMARDEARRIARQTTASGE